MIKYWQSMQDYKYFLTESKSHFDSSERNRLHTELWEPWQKLRLFDTDKAMEFLLPFYSNTGRPAMNQPQILRSFILFFLLFSDGLTKLSLTLWVDRLKHDRVLAALIGCTPDSLPPLGSYFDFMDRLWTAPPTDLYARDKLLPASWGWDSDLDKFYFGYTLFQLSCYNSELRTDIPLLLRFTSARRHDSVNFLVAFHELEKHMPAVPIENMCLDSAMDNSPTYRLLKKREIRAFIGLNDKCGRPKTIPDVITIDKDGTPLCQEKLRMKPNGYDSSSGYLMWRCPYRKEHCSKCKNSCTDSKYGRVVKTRPEWDIRLYTDVPRGTDTYKKIYNQRTATERINNRILNERPAPHVHTYKGALFFHDNHDRDLHPSGCPL